MDIKNNKVVTIFYTVSGKDGNVLESSEKNGLLSYIHGMGFLSPGMEKALSGKKAGDKVDTAISAADAFGEYESAMLFDIPRSEFPVSDEELKVGLEFQAEIKGDVRFCRVEKTGDSVVTVNANHPYAGLDVRFEAEIKEVRDALPEEISHGHVHSSHSHDECSCGCGDGEECGCGCDCDDDEEDCGCGCGHSH